VPTGPVDPSQIWGRTAGASAAARSDELRQESGLWATGSIGEQRVGGELDRLPAGSWWVFHDVPRGSSGTNIDHLVIGVGGIFTVNTKNVTGNVWVAERTLMVSGTKTDFLPVATAEARDVSQRLSLAIGSPVVANPLLAFLKPPTVKAMPDDVTVLHLGNIHEWLQSRPSILTAEQAYDVVLAANDATTWI
jgi:hypothetical protein